ncbi:uncharacterized protein LOC143242409 isoform X2 [Tachypleus tridentatus]|uniref:uncharacterized protein LOC143242409 isoform X2 n=1 Tax=Tachypleus tridentatus TaxID=6853 RepID=UPI003FD4828B
MLGLTVTLEVPYSQRSIFSGGINRVENRYTYFCPTVELFYKVNGGEKTILYYLVVMSQVHEEIYHTKYYTDIKFRDVSRNVSRNRGLKSEAMNLPLQANQQVGRKKKEIEDLNLTLKSVTTQKDEKDSREEGKSSSGTGQEKVEFKAGHHIGVSDIVKLYDCHHMMSIIIWLSEE